MTQHDCSDCRYSNGKLLWFCNGRDHNGQSKEDAIAKQTRVVAIASIVAAFLKESYPRTTKL